jgi:hypothetical protein
MRLLVVVGVLAGCGHSTSVASDAPPALLDAPTNDGAGPGGGLLTDLRFAVVGDTRPANLDDTANYPTPIVSAIWADVEAEVPHPLFAVSTGDYMFASTAGSQQGPQLDAYLGARATFHGVAYAAMGNHECNGFTSSNCGPGGNDGEPANYLLFLSKLVAPIGELRPYYLERFAAWDGSWSAKFVFIAANAWNQTQSNWLEAALSEPSTYTFVIRHEPDDANAPGVDPSTTILAKHPLTLLIVGHTHTYRHTPALRQIIVGNGGAPLTSSMNYGYVIVARNPDGTLEVTSRDYQTLAIVDQFTVMLDGTSH